MSRIRSVHPGLFTDEAFAFLSDAAQILLIGIWTECDDQGAFEWKPGMLRMRLRPGKDGAIEPLLGELQQADCIRSYYQGGRKYGLVRNFQRFQRPKKPNAIHFIPPEFRNYVGSSHASSVPDDPEDTRSTELDEVERASVPKNGEPTPIEAVSIPKKSEKSPQMEDVGCRMEEVERKILSAHPDAPSPVEPASRGDPDGFSDFWEIYPKRDGSPDRKGAVKAFRTALKRAPLQTILDGTEHFSEAMTARGKVGTEYVPQARTWLNGDRWNERYDHAGPADTKAAQNLAILAKYRAAPGS